MRNFQDTSETRKPSFRAFSILHNFTFKKAKKEQSSRLVQSSLGS